VIQSLPELIKEALELSLWTPYNQPKSLTCARDSPDLRLMSQFLAPKPLDGASVSSGAPVLQRPRKISTACLACKQRNTKCIGGAPCGACASRSTECTYDASADQRRKVAYQRNLQDLGNALASLERHRQLLGGIIATISAGDSQAINDLVSLIRAGVDLTQLAAHVRNGLRTSTAMTHAYNLLSFEIDGQPELPSPSQLLYDAGPEALRAGSSGSGSSASSVSSSRRTTLSQPR